MLDIKEAILKRAFKKILVKKNLSWHLIYQSNCELMNVFKNPTR